MILKSWCKPHLHHVFENPETTKNEQISQISKFTNFAEIKILKWKIAVFTASSCSYFKVRFPPRYIPPMVLRAMFMQFSCSSGQVHRGKDINAALRKSFFQQHHLNSALLDYRPQKSFSFAMDRNECVTCYRRMVMKRWMMMWIQPLLN